MWWWILIKILAALGIIVVCNISGAYVGMRMAQRHSSSDMALKYAVAESELERLLNERDEARTALMEARAERPTAYWIYDNPPDENDNLQAVCSNCYAGDTHSKNLRDKVHFCWKCGAIMGPGPTIYEVQEHE